MREARQRSEAVLDEVSSDLGEVLRHADALLAEWSAFGASVKAQVEREANAIGAAVASSVDSAVARAVTSGIDRAMPEQWSARMASLSAELTKLEHRARTAARSRARRSLSSIPRAARRSPTARRARSPCAGRP